MIIKINQLNYKQIIILIFFNILVKLDTQLVTQNSRHFMKTKEDLLFCLGGYDLEMEEIKKILAAHNIDFLDAGLSWGASWKEYQEEPYGIQITRAIANGKTIVGIELAGFPANEKQFLSIDHHNERQNEPCAIEQIASLLNIQLNRWQQLVAANDKGYIPALKSIGAKQQEIDQIRIADRKAQGVTAEDERLAEIAITNQSNVDDVVIVYMQGERFSPVADRMYGKAGKLIIHSDSELNYYGINKSKVVKHFQDYVHEGAAYHGGGEIGYFGFAKDRFDSNQLKEFKKQITKIVRGI